MEGSVQLNGEWEFYWNQLVDPDSQSLDFTYEVFPQLWNDIERDGVSLGSFGYATYKLKIVLPEDCPTLAIQIPDYYSSYNLFLNDRLFAMNGIVATVRENYDPKFIPMTRALAPIGDTVLLTMQIANFEHYKGGTRLPMIVGESSSLFKTRVIDFSIDIFLAGSLVMGGLFFLGLFMFGNKSKPLLYFSLFCIVYGYRIIGSDLYAVLAIFYHMPLILILRLEYLTLHLSGFLFLKYQYSLYPKELPGWFDRILSTLFLILALISAFFSPYWFTQTITPFFVLLIIGVPFVLVAQVLSVLRKRIGAPYIIMSTIVVFFVFVYSFLVYFGTIEGSKFVVFVCYIIFFFLQSLVLSFRFSTRLKRAKAQAEQAAIAKTEFLSTMSHEIRTPLNAVVGLTNYLIGEKPREDQKESLETLRFSSENLLALINDILDYNKIDAGKVEFEERPVNLRELISGLINAYKKNA